MLVSVGCLLLGMCRRFLYIVSVCYTISGMGWSDLNAYCYLYRRVLVSADYTISDDGHHILYRIISPNRSDVSVSDDDDYLLETRVNYDVTDSSPAECWDCWGSYLKNTFWFGWRKDFWRQLFYYITCRTVCFVNSQSYEKLVVDSLGILCNSTMTANLVYYVLRCKRLYHVCCIYQYCQYINRHFVVDVVRILYSRAVTKKYALLCRSLFP